MLNTGRFIPQKAQNDYLHIASLTLQQVPELRFFLLGDGELQEKLQQETRELGIQDSVVFLPFRKDVESVYDVMDILLHPAHREPFANVLLEGMAAPLRFPGKRQQTGGSIPRSGIRGSVSKLRHTPDTERICSEKFLCGLTGNIPHARIGPMFQQQKHHIHIPFSGGKMQGGFLKAIQRIDFRTVL